MWDHLGSVLLVAMLVGKVFRRLQSAADAGTESQSGESLIRPTWPTIGRTRNQDGG